MVEDSQRGLRPRVSNGVQPLAPGPSHTLSDRKEMVMCPGPLPLASGVYLIGGTESSRTSEKVKLDGSVEEGFGLKYDIRLKSGIELIYLHKDIFTFFASFSCAIPDPFKEEVMITGGRGTTNQVSINTVSVYTEDGRQRDIAPLNQGRFWHACSSYLNAGRKVIILSF